MGDGFRAEHDFDYNKAKPNRFAASLQKGGRLVMLDPEVAAAFENSDAVNAVLRALLLTMPNQRKGQVCRVIRRSTVSSNSLLDQSNNIGLLRSWTDGLGSSHNPRGVLVT